MSIVAYSLEAGGASFALRQRATGLWRVKVDDQPLGDAFDSAQAALDFLARTHPVPPRLDEWEAESDYDSRFG